MKYPDDFINKVICGDCREVLKEIPHNSVDAIITDPPYGLMNGKGRVKTSRDHDDRMTMEFITGDWDTEIPLTWIKDAIRILKEGSWFVCFTGDTQTKLIWDEAKKYGLRPKQLFYWIRSNPTPQPRRNFCSGVQVAVVGTKGAVKKWYGGSTSKNYFVTNVPEYGIPRFHPTQKPESLMRYLVSRVTKVGDLVIDPFSGSGSTLVASNQLQRQFIGIELIDEYNKIAVNRIESDMVIIDGNRYREGKLFE